MKKDYNYSKNKKCPDCDKLISDEAIKCRTCFGKDHIIHGKSNKISFCKDCGEQLNMSACFYGTVRCRSCSCLKRYANKHNHPRFKGIKHYCIDCNKKISHNAKTKTNRCWKCFIKFNIGENNPITGRQHTKEERKLMSLLAGGTGIPHEFSEYSQDFTDYLKKSIRDRDNHECQVCHIKEEDLDRKLDVHHIDYNKMNCNEENLISLCLSCHVKTNYDRDYWFAYFNYIMENLYELSSNSCS